MHGSRPRPTRATRFVALSAFLLTTPGPGGVAGEWRLGPSSRPPAQQTSCPTSAPFGDANGDGSANIIDAQQIARYSVGLSVARAAAVQYAGDVTGDGNVNIIDAQQIARHAVGLPAAARLGTRIGISASAASMSIASATQAMVIGDSVALSASATDAMGNQIGACAALVWTSSDSTIVGVSSTGVAVARHAGTIVITAQVGSTAAVLPVAISPSPFVAAVVSATDSTVVSTASGATISVQPGTLPAGSQVFIADVGPDARLAGNQIGSTIAIRTSALSASAAPLPSGRTTVARSLQRLQMQSPNGYAISISVAGAPATLQGIAISAQYTVAGSSRPFNDYTVSPAVAGPTPATSVITLQGPGALPTSMLVSVQGVPSVSPPCPANAYQFRDPSQSTPQVLAGRIPLILIHGWVPDKGNCVDFTGWDPATSYFPELYQALHVQLDQPGDYQTWVMRYPTNRPVAEGVAYLTQQINALFPTGPLVIVAHSMGGLVAAKYVNDNSGAAGRLLQLVTLGTPYRGSPIADVALGTTAIASFCETLAQSISYPRTLGMEDLSPSSALYSNSSAGFVSSRAQWWSKTSVYYGNISNWSPSLWANVKDGIGLEAGDCTVQAMNHDNSDGVVPVKSALDPSWGAPALSHEWIGRDHNQLMSDDAAVQEVVRRLGQFTPPQTTTVYGTGPGINLIQPSTVLYSLQFPPGEHGAFKEFIFYAQNSSFGNGATPVQVYPQLTFQCGGYGAIISAAPIDVTALRNPTRLDVTFDNVFTGQYGLAPGDPLPASLTWANPDWSLKFECLKSVLFWGNNNKGQAGILASANPAFADPRTGFIVTSGAGGGIPRMQFIGVLP